jgi:tRNA(Ile)-lysidine synthase
MSRERGSRPSASDPSATRFRGDVARLLNRAFDATIDSRKVRLALAVSGGPDSMAMLALAHAAFPGHLIAATFDHRLRAGSADEARMVAEACASIGVPHATLHPDAPIAGASIQAQARAARYAALTAWASAAGGDALLTAHHADDQAETLLMRLNRASGVAGLAGIRPYRFEQVPILRPLLGWRREELRAIVADSGLPSVDDPSNHDLRHGRTGIRALLAASPVLDAAALAASAAYLGEAEEVLSGLAARLWEERWRGPNSPFVLYDLAREMQRRLLRRAVDDARGSLGIALPAFGDGSNVERVLDALADRRGATIGGLMIARDGDGWVFRAAPPRRSH